MAPIKTPLSDHYAEPVYIVSILLIHIMYAAVFFGFIVSIPEQIVLLNFAIETFLCVILMIRFNPFYPIKVVSDFDRMLIFGSAAIIFTNIVLVQIVKMPIVKRYFPQLAVFDNMYLAQNSVNNKNNNDTSKNLPIIMNNSFY